MASIQRLRVGWSGFPGGPGVSTFYFNSASAAQGSVQTMLVAVSGLIPLDVTMRQESTGDIIDDATGDLTGAWVGADQAAVNGLGGGSYAAPVGFAATWTTGTFLDGKRLRGRTFFVPGSSAVYQADGSIDNGQLATLRGIFTAFVLAEDLNMVVWHRPRFGPRPVGGGARPITRAGGSGVVTASTVKDRAVVLRSRRD